MVVLCNTFLFADLCDYTEHSFRHGDEFAAELAVGFHVLVRELAEDEGCEVVKVNGDAVMVRAFDVADAIRLADRIHASIRGLGFPPVRIGIDTGPAVPREGDWYGTTVNRAARVAEAARPGEMLLTERARAALGASSSSEMQIVSRGVRELKGLPHSRLHAAYARRDRPCAATPTTAR
jgi:adenylate cyclase